MANVVGLTAQPLDPGRDFSWIFLVELLVCGILTLFFLFYFNRLFATLVSYGIRAYTWRKYRVYVDIQALQISLLGGRVFFKGIRYHGENETFLIQQGYITWNYWLRAVKQADCSRFNKGGVDRPGSSNEDVRSAARSSGFDPDAKEAGAVKAAQDLPSRISVSISGFEWFVYNRSPVYAVIAASQELEPGNHVIQPDSDDAKRRSAAWGTVPKESFEADGFGTQQLKQFLTRPSTKSTSCDYSTQENTNVPRQSLQSPPSHVLDNNCNFPPVGVRATESSPPGSRQGSPSAPSATPWILTLFPVLVECQKGAIVIGNEHTRAILTTSFERSRGHIDASSASSRDLYRQIFQFEVTHPVVRMKPNPDYRQSQQGAAQTLMHNAASPHNKESWTKINLRFRHRKRKVVHSLRNLVPYFLSSVESFRPSSADKKNTIGKGNWPHELPGESRWLGLSRYLDENERDDHEGWSNVEYARFSNIVDSPSVHFSFYWDVPGRVTTDHATAYRPGSGQDINLAKPPAYGLDLTIRGGNVDYGPWADRARAEIQSVFLPNAYQDAVPADPLPVEAIRQSTVLKINIHIENEMTVRLPTRENSKDWQWKGRAGALRGASRIRHQKDKKLARKKKGEKNLLGPDVRPFGWFSVSVSPNSSITYNMGMVARKQGYHNDLELDLKGTKMTTSVNHDLLWRCGPQKISCDLSNPLRWNALHTWTFDVQSHGMELFLLRDHVFLLTDLISDFTSGPASDFLTFVPFLYRLTLSFKDIKLYLNANDSNIIDNPCDSDENTFLMLHGETLDVTVDIPLSDYAPSENKVNFKATAQDARLDLAMPVWNTIHIFASDLPTATLKDFSMDGSYNYWSGTSPSLTDSLFLNLSGFSPRIFLQGSLIRYCMKLKDNYFGEDMHFRTLEEYQQLLFKQKDAEPGPVQFQNKKDNDLDVILNVTFDRVCVLLPANIYSRKENLRIDFLLVEADVRFTNYYMDVEAKFSPVEAAWESVKAEQDEIDDYVSKPQAFVDGIGIYGHRLFGSAPSEPTYVCNWDFDIGKVMGDCATQFVRIFLQAIRSFAFTLKDDENALPQSHIPMIHDITFLRAKIVKINLWFLLEETAILFGAGHAEITFNDWAGKSFSERLNLVIPNIQLAAVDQMSAMRHKNQIDSHIPTYALFQLSLLLKMVERKRDFAQDRELQQQHVQLHDQRTHRTSWLLHNPSQTILSREQPRRLGPNPPAMSIPQMPAPLSKSGYDHASEQRTQVGHRKESTTSRLRHKSSFVSNAAFGRRPSLQSRRASSKVAAFGANQVADERASRSRSRNKTRDDGISARPADSLAWRYTCERASPGLKSATTYSSPWTAPYFPLQKVAPDARDLPELPENANLATKSRSRRHIALETSEFLDDDSATVHTRYDIDLGSAVRGFTTPVFFTAVAALLKALESVHPTDLLDDLQVDTISQLLRIANIRTELGQTTDCCVRVPFAHMRIIDSNSPWQKPSGDATRDRYDLQVVKSQITARSNTKEKMVGNRPETESGMRLHISVKRSLLEVHDRALDVLHDKAAARVLLEDLVFWIASDDRTIAKIQLQDLEVTSWGSRIEYLASLIHRTVDMSDFIVDQFADMNSANRMQSLVYHLTIFADGITDPVFLTRPSYVLRTADDHMRLNDSWKIASRLRYMLQSLDNNQRKSLLQSSGASHVSVPSNAEDAVLASFDKWRSWDLAHVRKSLVMEIIWRNAEAVGDVKSRKEDLSFELIVEKANFLLDPGLKENQIGIHDISAALCTRNERDRDLGEPNTDILQRRIVMVQSYCSRFRIHLNWELVELIGDMMDLFERNPKKLRHSSSRPTKDKSHPVLAQQLHFVFGMDSGIIALDSINIAVTMAASGARGSILHEVKGGDAQTTCILLKSRSASTRLKDDSKVVLGWLLSNSTLSLSRSFTLHRDANPDVVKATGKCENLHFEMRQDISYILDVAKNIIRDELHILRGLLSQLPGSTQSAQAVQNREAPDTKRRHEIHIALFLDQYTISIAILPLLAYVISGNGARTSVVPRSSSKMAINFDLEHHSHSFKLKSKESDVQVAILDVPPINGKVIASRSPQSTDLNLDVTVDKVEMDAKSVRSCVDTINTPEVVRTLLNAKKSAQDASSQLDTLFSSSPQVVAKASDSSVAVLYAANVTFIGLVVHASAPALKSKGYRADLEFVLGLTTVHLRNEGVEEGLVHEQPQFDIAFRHISLNIYRQNGGNLTKYGNLDLTGKVQGKTEADDSLNQIRTYHAASDRFEVDLHPETASLAVDIAAHLQERIKSFTLPDEVKRLKPLRRLTVAGFKEAPTITVTTDDGKEKEETSSSSLFDSIYSLELNAIKIAWRLDASMAHSPTREVEDLIFSIQKVNLNTKRGGSATLAISELQLQMVPKSLEAHHRSLNSALMPEVVFKAAHLSTKSDRRLAFQAAGKALDLRIASDFIVPATAIRTSLVAASAELRQGSALWAAQPVSSRKETNSLFSSKYLASLLIDADFAGAVVKVQARKRDEGRKSIFGILKGDKRSRAGRYDQVVQGDSASQASLRAPGVAMKIEYSDNAREDPVLNAEIKVAASSNVLYPSVVPLIIETTSSFKEIMGGPSDGERKPKSEIPKPLANNSLGSSDPTNLMGRCKLNLGLWIREQDFSLSCQPIARVAATARFNDIFMAVNTVQSPDQERFFALSITFSDLKASVQHVYSRESTASLEVDSIVLSLMNSKHVSNTTGVSAILNVSPMKASVNAKQLQDFLLFREIWYPAELRQDSATMTTDSAALNNQALVVQRYQQVAAAGAFPWNAVVSVQELIVQMDLGQSLGKSVFTISQLWASSKKASDFEQNLCVGFDKVKVESTGRMSGFVELQNFQVRTSIRWPQTNPAIEQTPLVQASLGVDQFRVKAAFDYQAFAIAEISKFEFLMYNVRPNQKGEKDRLVGNLEGEKVQVFCTTASASQALALYQAVVRLVQEKEMAYEASLRELDKYMRRKSVFPSSTWTAASTEPSDGERDVIQGPFSLHTDVVVTLRSINIGAFPSTFYDNQIFKVEATDAQARFAVSARGGKTHSGLGLTLGQLRIALSNVNRANTQALVDVSVDDVVSRATSSRGGTILKVPKVVAAMQTWQSASSNHIDYIFKSTFEGKVDVGWNYSRISFIRGMWSTHSRALASRLGKPLPQSAVQITGGPQPDDGGEGSGQEKITAVVNVPQSRFEYNALEPPIIETPQLRDMGEATPPLEWIGLHRDKLPNVTHQIIIVTLLEVAKEVEDAYSKILGSSQ